MSDTARRARLAAAGAIALLLPLAACRQQAAATPPPLVPSPAPAELAAVVTAHRQVIALLDEGNGLPAPERSRAEMVARVIFHENRQRLDRLGESLAADLIRVGAALDYIENDADLRDADKLAFRDLLTDLAGEVGEKDPAGAPGLRARLQADLAVLGQIQARYDKELEKIFGRLGTRGIQDRRESWEGYLAFLRTRVDVNALLRERTDAVSDDEVTRGSGESAQETFGRRLPDKAVVLTFDDGPHARHTDRIREILARYGAKAVFFHVGQNLGTLGKDRQVHATRAAAASQRLLEAGHALANHSFSHSFLPKLDETQLAHEIDAANRMLVEVSHADTDLFRAPYGARNEKVRAALASRKLRSIMWNVDSQDWADPVPASIADRVVRVVEAEKRGIVLFHDIQQRTVEALPLVLEALQARGYRFLSWNGREFVDDGTRSASSGAPEEPAGAASFYRESWAVVVGIDQYKSWPRLNYAVNDAKGVRDLLIRRYRFKPENVVTLLDGEATRAAILSALGDRLADPQRIHRDDRVFVFFAGHGVTRRLPSGKSLGYLVPVDADRESYQSQAISMTNFQDVSEAIPAKHILFVTDACYSGVALTRGGAAGSAGLAYLREVTRRAVRQMLTAGGADEEVADGGPQGHSIFTWALMQGLDGQADLSGDGVITASELAAYVGPTVSALSRQTPAFGNLVGSEGGEFVFELKHDSEFLSEVSSQLDDEAIKLNAELAKVRQEIAQKRSRNEKLREELAAAQAQLGGASPAPGRGPRTAAERNDVGMVHFRERRYVEALAEFEAAARLGPTVALFANNAGFACYKLGKNDEAAAWFEKTLALDPKRAIAHANLGDAHLAAGRPDAARTAYEKYLELAPTARYASEVKKKLEGIK